MKILVFDIQRYSIHDGPGIRTTVFLKGCNMRCIWCENPESISTTPQISFARERCLGCRGCEKACPINAINIKDQFPIDRARCDLCGACVSACPAKALNMVGMWRDSGDLVKELLLDRDYWVGSNGGVTISGGEATLQMEALIDLLARLQNQGIHTVLQTNGKLPWEELEFLAGNVNMLHFDLKGMNSGNHRSNTGVGNERILENAGRLVDGGYPVVFRIPFIPGYNNSIEDFVKLRDFLESINAQTVDILPYHNLGEGKLNLIGQQKKTFSPNMINRADVLEKAQILYRKGRTVLVSGDPI